MCDLSLGTATNDLVGDAGFWTTLRVLFFSASLADLLIIGFWIDLSKVFKTWLLSLLGEAGLELAADELTEVF